MLLQQYLCKYGFQFNVENILQIARFSLTQVLNELELICGPLALNKLIQSNFEAF